ncbi:tail fiber domain-containing protein [bacterium]|nr:tail fiber domain-containing protein [bacterium]
MIINKGSKSAFSLTELLIVLMIIAVLFAALAPIMTKRKVVGGDWSNESVWNYVTGDPNRDSYFDPQITSWPSIAFIGVNPGDLTDANDYNYGGKLTIRAKTKQHMIQFRYGSDTGANTGSLFIDRGNMLLGTGFYNRSNDTGSDAFVRNTVLGLNTFRLPSNALNQNMTTVGSFTMFDSSARGGSSLTAIGTNAARDYGLDFDATPSWSTFVGANAGRTENAPDTSVGVGYNSLFSPNLWGAGNTVVGANTGNGLTGRASANSRAYPKVSGGYNVIGSSGYYGTTAQLNTILGYGTYVNKNPEMSFMTAVGYGACDSFTADVGVRTCIGYKSASAVHGTNSATGDPMNENTGNYVFLGGTPYGGFAGRSVLEVHNIAGGFSPTSKDPNASVVLNSNLVVRGRLFAPETAGYDGKLARYGYRPYGYLDPIWTCDRFLLKYWGCALTGGWALFNKSTVSNNFLSGDQNSGVTNASSYGFVNVDGFPNLKSDIRLKENLSNNNDGIDKILNIESYHYTFKADENSLPQVGVIAQKLQKIFPNAVRKGDDGYLRIHWDEMFYALINAVKHINERVEKIAHDVAQMVQDVDTLSDSNKSIQKRVSDLNARAAKLEKK